MKANGLIIIFSIFILVSSAENADVITTIPPTIIPPTTTTPKPIRANYSINSHSYPSENFCNLKLEISSRVKIELSEDVKIADIKKLVIENQTMNFMPDNLKEYFPNVIEIQILNSNLKEVLSSDLAQFEKLTKLHIIGNKIQEIKADLFSNNPKIEEIDFSRNKIGLIESTAFDNLNAIKKIDLRDNTCINETFESGEVIKKVKESIENKCTKADLALREGKKMQKDMEAIKTKLNEDIKLLSNKQTDQEERIDQHKKSIEVQKERIESLNGESNTIIVIIVVMIIFMMAAAILGTVYYVKKIHNHQRETFNGNINL